LDPTLNATHDPGGRRRERRAARRWVPQELPWPIACRVTPGHEALIVNLSAVGVLIEADSPLAIGRPVIVHLIRPSRRVVLEGQIVRCHISGLSRGQAPLFQAGIAFARWFEPLWELDSLCEEVEEPKATGLGRSDG
jgi:hypothetical protein